jgi:hypothetical protein
VRRAAITGGVKSPAVWERCETQKFRTFGACVIAVTFLLHVEDSGAVQDLFDYTGESELNLREPNRAFIASFGMAAVSSSH